MIYVGMAALARFLTNDPALRVFDYLAIRDVFALMFVSEKTRLSAIALIKKWRWLSKRARLELEAHLTPEQHYLVDAMSTNYGFFSGSLVLHIILGADCGWDFEDIDMYMMGRTMCERITNTIIQQEELDRMGYYPNRVDYKVSPYMINRHEALGINMGARDHMTKYDVLDANRGGPNEFDITIVQNWLWPNGRMRVIDPWAIVHMEIKWTNLAKRELLGMAWQWMNHAGQHEENRKPKDEYEHGNYLRVPAQIGQTEAISNRLTIWAARAGKYSRRDFLLTDDIALFCSHFAPITAMIRETYPSLTPIAERPANLASLLDDDTV
jgi:hypothetical protein